MGKDKLGKLSDKMSELNCLALIRLTNYRENRYNDYEPIEFGFAEKSMLGDEEMAKLRGVIIIPGCVDTTEIVEDGDDNLEPRLVSLGDIVDDDNTLETPVPSLMETLILFKFSFKDDEDEAASEISSIFIFLMLFHIKLLSS